MHWENDVRTQAAKPALNWLPPHFAISISRRIHREVSPISGRRARPATLSAAALDAAISSFPTSCRRFWGKPCLIRALRQFGHGNCLNRCEDTSYSRRLAENSSRSGSGWNFGPAEADANLFLDCGQTGCVMGEKRSCGMMRQIIPEGPLFKLDASRERLNWAGSLFLPLNNALDWSLSGTAHSRTGNDLPAITLSQLSGMKRSGNGDIAGLQRRETIRSRITEISFIMQNIVILEAGMGGLGAALPVFIAEGITPAMYDRHLRRREHRRRFTMITASLCRRPDISFTQTRVSDLSPYSVISDMRLSRST